MAKHPHFFGTGSATFGPVSAAPLYLSDALFRRWAHRGRLAAPGVTLAPWPDEVIAESSPEPQPAAPVAAGAKASGGIGFAAWAAIIAACLIMLLSTGLRSTMGLFVQPTSAALAISVGAFSFSVAAHMLLWGVFQPIAGVLADRLGPVPALLLGALAYAGGFAVMAEASTSTELFLGVGVAIGVALACTSFGVMAGAVARLVPPKDRSTMFGIIAGAGALGQAAVVPVTQQALDGFDWRTVAWGLAAVACVIALLGFAFTGRGGSAGTASDEPEIGVMAAFSEAIRHPGYLMLTVGFFVCGFQLIFIISHLPNFLALCGLPPSTAGSAIAVIGVCNAIGCYGFGRLGAVYSRKRLLALIYLVRAISIALYLSFPITVASTLVFACVMGFFWLGTAPLTSGMVTHMLGARYLSSIYGPVFFSHQFGAFLGVWLGGVVFDWTGGYDRMWLAAGVIGLIAAGFHLAIPDRRVPRLQFV